MKQKTVNIDNFIGVYDNYITEEQCDNAINLYEKQNEFKKTLNRIGSEQSSILKKQDQQFFANEGNLDVWWKNLEALIINFDMAWKHYEKNVGALDSYGQDKLYYTSLKIQKTLPTEGYHVWHLEHSSGFNNEPRAFVYSVYLNDVEEGGETEFLYQRRRIKPEQGTLIMFPAGYTHVHRGNPPLSGDKYFMNSWIELVA